MRATRSEFIVMIAMIVHSILVHADGMEVSWVARRNVADLDFVIGPSGRQWHDSHQAQQSKHH
jgi:hypothetical protein